VKSARELVKHPIYITIYIIPFSGKHINAIRCNHLTAANSIQLQIFMTDYYIVSQKISMTKFFCYLQKLI